MHALLVGHAAPGLVARLARRGHGPPPPQLLAGERIVRDHDARLRPAPRPAAPPGHDPAVGDDRAGAVAGRCLPVVEDLRLPRGLAGRRVERVGVVVVADVDDEPIVDGDVPHAAGVAAHVLVDVLRQVAAVLPDEVAGHRIDGLDDVAAVRHVERAVVGQRRHLLRAGHQRARPGETEVADVLARHLVQRAVAPAVERAAPHRPVRGVGILQHGVGDGHEVGAGLCNGRRRHGGQRHGGEDGDHEGRCDESRLRHLETPRTGG